MSSLKLDNISKSFGDFPALENINLEFSEGEFFSIVGPSGCGKSTLLRIIAGLESPSAGKVVLGGKDITSFSPQKRKVGIVFQNYALFPHMTVFQNVSYGLEIKKIPRAEIEKKVTAVLGKVKISEKKNINVSTLSGGEQQRVSLARVIVTEPGLLLFDEPLSNLDYALRLETRNEIKRLQRDLNITSVYVTHDQSEALSLSDRIAVLNRGRVQQVGTPEKIYYEPDNLFTADFIGHYNLFDRDFSRDVLKISIGENETLAVLPEEIKIIRSELGAGIITDLQFTGFTTDITILSKGKLIKVIMPSNKNLGNSNSEENFNLNDKVNLKVREKRIIPK